MRSLLFGMNARISARRSEEIMSKDKVVIEKTTDEKIDKDELQSLAIKLESLICFAMSIDKILLEKCLNKLKKEVTQYEAIGIIDGMSYFDRLDNRKALYKRMKSILDMINVFHDTDKHIKKKEGLGESDLDRILKEKVK